MDWTQVIITAVTVLLSSGIVQFFVNRSDKMKEEAKKNELDELRKEFKEGLDERERVGKNRYEEHHISIEKMSLQHQKDFQALIDAIDQLKANDTNITQSIQDIKETQKNIGDAVMGLAHDKLIFCADKISERGYITLREKATLKSMYVPYKKLGGNGDVATAYDYVTTLAVIDDAKAKELDRT